jgi:V/A-type H+-transporting ATPase subunit K
MKSKTQLMLSFLLMIIGALTISTMAVFAFSQGPTQVDQTLASEKGLFLVGAGIAAGLASCGAGIGLGTASAAAIGAIAEKPEMLGRTLLFVVLIEAIAIYGLAMFFIIYSRI